MEEKDKQQKLKINFSEEEINEIKKEFNYHETEVKTHLEVILEMEDSVES